MALVHPGKVAPVRATREIHPVIFFLAGFALIGLAATTVHAVFSLI
jgi:hypothetical protein